MFNKEFVRGVMDLYGCNQLAVDDQGRTFAIKAEGQFLIPDFVLDTYTVDGSVMRDAVDIAKGE